MLMIVLYVGYANGWISNGLRDEVNKIHRAKIFIKFLG